MVFVPRRRSAMLTQRYNEDKYMQVLVLDPAVLVFPVQLNNEKRSNKFPQQLGVWIL